MRVGLLSLICLLAPLLASCRFGIPAGGQPAAGVNLPHTSSSPSSSTTRAGSRSYVVRGKRYVVLASARGFAQRGVASWYGKKFHSRQTSNGETYNMYAMTAAHKTLPLPTWVEVKNLENGRTIRVRVNDRGPFVDDRIIDLSYAAANELGMVTKGTAEVEIRALEHRNASAGAQQPVGPLHAAEVDEDLFVQIAAFGAEDSARALAEKLRTEGLEARLFRFSNASGVLYRVRIGPQNSVAEAEQILARVQGLGYGSAQIVFQ